MKNIFWICVHINILRKRHWVYFIKTKNTRRSYIKMSLMYSPLKCFKGNLVTVVDKIIIRMVKLKSGKTFFPSSLPRRFKGGRSYYYSLAACSKVTRTLRNQCLYFWNNYSKSLYFRHNSKNILFLSLYYIQKFLTIK